MLFFVFLFFHLITCTLVHPFSSAFNTLSYLIYQKSDVGDKLMELVYFSIHTVCTWVGASSFVWCFLRIYFNLPKKIFWFYCLKNWAKRH